LSINCPVYNTAPVPPSRAWIARMAFTPMLRVINQPPLSTCKADGMPLDPDLSQHEILGDSVRNKLRYHPTITREPHPNHGRLTTLIESGKLFRDLSLPAFDPRVERVMVCGSPAMLTDTCKLLDSRGFGISPHIGEPGDYVIERAFVQR
jgi:ferredoxin-NADP reductase